MIHKNNPVPQPNHHWGDGLEKDALAFGQLPHAAQRVGQQRDLQLRRLQPPRRHRQSRTGATSTAGATGTQIYPLGFLPNIEGLVTDYSMAGGLRGLVSGWSYDLGAEFGHNDFDYEIGNTLNASLGPCMDVACAPGADGVLGTADDPGIPNQTSFFAGRVLREELVTGLNIAKPVEIGLPKPVNLAFGATFRRERYAIRAGELGSYVNGGRSTRTATDRPRGARNRSRASRPAMNPTGIAPTSGSTPTPRPISPRRSSPRRRSGSSGTATSARA